MAGKAGRRLFLGLDTSAYTTSLALVDQDERLVWEKRSLLPVREGALGLRQSEAVFAHLANLPQIWKEGSAELAGAPLCGIAAATRPRPQAGSYMPVFKVSEAFGTFLAQSLGLFFLPSTHQEGHIFAGLWSAGLAPGRYLVLHLSGGTTEILTVAETGPGALDIALQGGAADLNAGQFVDRLGAAMGLRFPAGPGLEAMARQGRTGAVSLPVAVKGTAISFSGPAAHAGRLLDQGCSRHDLARAVEVCIADSLARAIKAAEGHSPSCRGILVVGGVAGNAFIRERLEQGLPGRTFYYASPAFAGDNAAGLAVQAARKYIAPGAV